MVLDEPATSDEQPQPPGRTMFDIDNAREREAEREMRRESTRRIAIWGLATGAVMAVVLTLCVVLLALASQSGG